MLDDYNTPRVQTHAGAALVNFSEQCPKSILVNYLDAIVHKLEKALEVGLKVLAPPPLSLSLFFLIPYPILSHPPSSPYPLLHTRY